MSLSGAHKNEVAFGIAALFLIAILIIPLPSFLLDIFLAFSLVISILTFLVVLFIEDSHEFNSFPSTLIFLITLRLGLNVASTRLILTHGEAGRLIATFGHFLTMGNAALGLLIFILITLINFIVITKGASRVAEVAARFVLEGLPGKQMAIDSELSSGMITERQGREKRAALSRESEFFGAMDGASKFVRGDAIASLLMIFINLLGGIILGMKMGHLTLHECFKTYTELTIGDGLASQLPALLVSLASAIIMTRASGASLSHTLPKQLFGHKKALVLGIALLVCLSFIPGMPKLAIFLVVLTLTFFLPKKEGAREDKKSPLLEIVVPSKSTVKNELASELKELTLEYSTKLGIEGPLLFVSQSAKMERGTFQIHLRGLFRKKGRAKEGSELLFQLREFLQSSAHELLNREDISCMVEKVRASNRSVVDELFPKKLSMGQLLKIVQNLLKEGVPITSFETILEALADHFTSSDSKDLDLASEAVRIRFSELILEGIVGSERVLHVITLDPKVEQMLSASVRKVEGTHHSHVGLRPLTLEKLNKELFSLMEQALTKQLKPAIVTSVATRRHLRTLLEKQLGELPVLSYDEITPEFEIQTLGSISSEVLI